MTVHDVILWLLERPLDAEVDLDYERWDEGDTQILHISLVVRNDAGEEVAGMVIGDIYA